MKSSEQEKPSTAYQSIRSKADLKLFLQADLDAHDIKRWYPLVSRVLHPELHYQRVLRRVEYCSGSRSPIARVGYFWWRFRLARLSLQSGISIPPNVFGPGLSIAHYGSIVVNDRARVGSYCRIHSATNIGVSRGLAPTIGDFVYIGPGAVIYGGVNVGSESVIGANAVVGSDVAMGESVAGIPARPIERSSTSSPLPPWITAIKETLRARDVR